MGIGEGSKIIMIILASFFPLFLNIQKGFVITNNELIEVGKVFSYSDMEIFRHIVLPSALKDIFTGIRIALGYAWRSIIAAEMIAASSGLGYRINFARQMSRTDKVIVGIIAIGLFGWITDFIFVKIANHFLKGDLKNEWYKS
jgi:sulfonate transport system permease protein